MTGYERYEGHEGEDADAFALRSALVRLRRDTGLPVALGGLLHDRLKSPPAPGSQRGRLRIDEVSGTYSSALQGIGIATGSGLGGKTVALSRPCAVVDYQEARHISHEYDAVVAAEGLRSVLAVPVIVRRQVRGVLYGALRAPRPMGERILTAAVAAARDVEQALVVREEAQALLMAAREPAVGADAWERVREAHSALRALAPKLDDPLLRAELEAVYGTLASAADSSVRAGRPAPEVRLAPREVDVLACVALGATNAAAAERLGLGAETVKGYLRSAMRKLGARSRWEAVVAARRAGLLP
ncbi:helix-turn-helix domain-containing protein [Streptomyces indicus]|uniref:GAF domain-containing protein n=1 Tax=Streptomyces indicus TaxID=417292 RepID=A0A1G8V314_9ACTN|nr:helix-turn-helix transcriptional regulator [Streptomyces indicus]SDJ60458.1 GAF domain-containing protein [Streptomyces indicus]